MNGTKLQWNFLNCKSYKYISVVMHIDNFEIKIYIKIANVNLSTKWTLFHAISRKECYEGKVSALFFFKPKITEGFSNELSTLAVVMHVDQFCI